MYELRCKEDDKRYRGTTAQSVYERTGEEVSAWEKEDTKSPLWKHSLSDHNGRRFEVGVKVLAKCYGKPSRRKITEAVLIEELPDDKTMNNKGEWTYVKLSRI